MKEIINTYDESIITPNDFKKKIDEIMLDLRDCPVKYLKQMFKSAMEAQGAKQDMSRFEPFTYTDADLFIRMIEKAVWQLDYNQLFEYHAYVIKIKNSINGGK